MANALYDGGRNRFARGEIAWKAGSENVIRAFLLDATKYNPDLAAHECLDDVPILARNGNKGASARQSAPRLTLINPVAGVCDAIDVTFAAIPPGPPLGFMLIFEDTGADASSPLIALLDSAGMFPVTPNGADITIIWDEGANKIFKL